MLDHLSVEEIQKNINNRQISIKEVLFYYLERIEKFNKDIRFQIEKNMDHSLPDGFSGSMRISCTTADTSLAATDEVYLTQSIEAQDLMAFAKGTSSAKQ